MWGGGRGRGKKKKEEEKEEEEKEEEEWVDIYVVEKTRMWGYQEARWRKLLGRENDMCSNPTDSKFWTNNCSLDLMLVDVIGDLVRR